MSADSFGRKEAYLANEYNSQPGPVKPTSGQIDEEMALEPIKSATPKKSRVKAFNYDRQSQNCMRKASTFEDDTSNQLARQGKETPVCPTNSG